MSLALHRIEQTRRALSTALIQRDWQAISRLDLACRACVDDVLSDVSIDQNLLRGHLESLLSVYRELLETTAAERDSAAQEMSGMQQGKKAMKVYQLFG